VLIDICEVEFYTNLVHSLLSLQHTGFRVKPFDLWLVFFSLAVNNTCNGNHVNHLDNYWYKQMQWIFVYHSDKRKHNAEI